MKVSRAAGSSFPAAFRFPVRSDTMSTQVLDAVDKSSNSGEPVQLNPTAPAQAGAREVVRCYSCSLVQFRTHSDQCRRCATSLRQPVAVEPAPGDCSTTTRKTLNTPSTSGEARTAPLEDGAIGPRLKELRQSRNLTQAQIAAKARVPRTYISRIEHSHLMPGLLVVRRLADALQVGVLELFPGHETTPRETFVMAGDDYWQTFVGSFQELRPDQQASVLAEIRSMLRQRLLQQRLAEYQNGARRNLSLDSMVIGRSM
jgi:transcriptional regulator with XRE-family HTH domain